MCNRCVVCNNELDEDEINLGVDTCMECDMEISSYVQELEEGDEELEEYLLYDRDMMFEDDGLEDL